MKNNMNLKSFLCGGLMALMVGGVFESECARAGSMAIAERALMTLRDNKAWRELPEKEKAAVVQSAVTKVTLALGTGLGYKPYSEDEHHITLQLAAGTVTLTKDTCSVVRDNMETYRVLSSDQAYTGSKEHIEYRGYRGSGVLAAASGSPGKILCFPSYLVSLEDGGKITADEGEGVTKVYVDKLLANVNKLVPGSATVRKS
jgi:hypothetical protein